MILYITLILFFSALMIRLFTLTNSESLAAAVSGKRSYSVTLAYSRGDITDRNGVSLLYEDESYYALCSPSPLRAQYIADRLSECSTQSSEKIYNKLTGSMPFAVRVSEQYLLFDNITVASIPSRYPEKGVATHLIGYTKENYSVGVCGLEASYNELLKNSGSITAAFTLSKSDGNDVVLRDTSSSGNSLMLTLDKGASRAAVDAFGEDKKGAVVVMDINNGDLIVCESFPSYDRNSIADYLDDEELPLLNRTLSSYNIGSAFKIVNSAAILQSGNGGGYYNCTGSIDVSGVIIDCHTPTGHGSQDLMTAFANSCNPYFIDSMLKVKSNAAYENAKAFGIGTSYTLASNLVSSGGLLPSESELRVKAALANFAIGQGDVMLSPLNAAVVVSAVANGGYRVTPRLVAAALSPDGETAITYENEEKVRIISETTAETIKDMMINAVNAGTGKHALPDEGGAGGKTATAQTGSFVDGERVTNAWFVGFCPADEPKYAIVVLVEGGGSGAKYAAPVFKSVADYLYKNEINPCR